MNVSKASLKIFFANIVGAGTNFLGVVLFSRELGASLLGTFFLFEAILGMAAIPANFGLRHAVEKRISEGSDQGAFLASVLITKLVPIALITGGVLAFRDSVNQYLGAELAVLLVLVLLLREYAQLSLFVLRGELRVGETAILKVTRQVGWLLVGALLVKFGYGVESLAYALLLGYGVVLLWGWQKVSIRLTKPTLSHTRSLFNYSRYSVVSSVGGYFYNWMDIILIGVFLSQEYVGAYEISWRVTMIVMLFSRALATTIFPQVSRWDAEEAIAQIENLIPTALIYSMLFVVPAFFGSLVLAEEILRIVFRIEIHLAWLALIILMGEKVLQSAHVVIGRSLPAIDQPDLAAYATVISVVVNLALNVLLIPRFGIVGAAIGTGVSFAVNTALHGYYLSKFIRIEIPVRRVGWISLASIGMGALVYVFTILVSVETLPMLIGMTILGAIIYFALIFSFQPLRRDLFDIILVFPSIYNKNQE